MQALRPIICLIAPLFTALIPINCIANEPAPDGGPSVAPLVNGFNDPNAIKYDAAHESHVAQLQDDWEPTAWEKKAGVFATIDVAGEYGRKTKYVAVQHADYVPLGRAFRSEDLLRFLDRRANGDLRAGTSELLIRDVCTVVDLCGRAELPLALSAMTKLLDDPDPQIRQMTYHQVPCVGSDSDALFDRLSKAMDDPDKASTIATNFYRFGPRGLHILMDAAMRHPDRTVIESIGSYRTIDQQTVMRLTALLANRQTDIQIAASFTLAHCGDDAHGAIPALIALHSRHANYSDAGYDALAQMGDQARSAMLADAQRSPADYRDAMEALGNGQPYSDGVPILVAALHGRDASVRSAAARGLHGSEAGEAVPELIRLLADLDENVRAAAAGALGAIGRAAAPAIPALRAVTPDNPQAADAAREIKRGMKED